MKLNRRLLRTTYMEIVITMPRIKHNKQKIKRTHLDMRRSEHFPDFVSTPLKATISYSLNYSFGFPLKNID